MKQRYAFIMLAALIILASLPVTAKNIIVDGNPSDWYQPSGIPGNTALYASGE
jgi:hypothetical protein